MGNRLKNAAKWIIELILNFIGVSILGGVLENMPAPAMPVSVQTIAGILVLIIAWVLGIYFVYTWKKSSGKNAKPNFDHVEARLFYPKKYSWEKGERDPKKNVPRLKLVLVKDLKKAYYVGDYALKLIQNGKIRPFSEDEQDLAEWCRKHGYVLIPEDGTEDKLLEPYFEAEIKNKKIEYHPREHVLFRTCYRGSLTNGFFENEIVHSEGKLFPSGQFQRKKNCDHSWPHETLSYWAKWFPIKGKLNGYTCHESEWSWMIPQKVPDGKYRIFMRVHNCIGTNTLIREKEETITVISRSGKSEKPEPNQNKQFLEEKLPVEETKTELLQALRFFPEHWATYKKLIENDKLQSPQSGEIKWCSDRIKSAIVRARFLNLNKINAVIPQIEALSNDMAIFGVKVQQFPRNVSRMFGNIKPVQDRLIFHGNIIYESVKKMILEVEQAFR
jgi:hypothetical protein